VSFLVSLVCNLGLFALLIHWIVIDFEPAQEGGRQVAATPERPVDEPLPMEFDEPPEPEEPDEGPPLPLMASEPWLTAPAAADDDLRVEPAAVPPGLFDFPEGPAAAGPVRSRGRRTGAGTTTPPPAPAIDVPADEPGPGAFPDDLLAGLERAGHVAVPAVRLPLRGALAQRIRDRIAEHRVYPEEAVDLGVEGRVVTRFRLDGRGRVHDFAVLNRDEVDPLLVEGARRSIEAAAPYPVPEITAMGGLYLAVACWTDGEGDVKRLRMVEDTGRDALDSAARARARAACARKPKGWHVVEFEESFRVRVTAQGDAFLPSLVEGDLPEAWVSAVRAELTDLVPPLASTAAIRIPITFRLTW